ncbi:glycosyltransferase [Methanoregula formicica]|uniref:Glycosyl transferase n=1 Tax=Methanoregula formicica (strain DSM 22288 / NBRC 105244 / SMSP) TaxID=593750 RepID=L0HI42_METFS|nr:glycosyltransferase family 2 protein [Methanoregula formicica]AGB02734.1 glycosyl transferase [Methanoregula formicica SMSP]
MISVVIPTFNEEENIAQCLVSLTHQTIPRTEYEIIVVDGGSKDNTCEIARKYADKVFTQTSRKVGGARNDGVMAARGDIIATTDADCILPPGWIKRIADDFAADPRLVQLYGPVYPIEEGLRNKFSLFLANTFSRIGYYSRTFYYTLGCNTAFRKGAFIKAGGYRCIDAGDDLEIAMRLNDLGKITFDGRLKVGFSMRRYQQFGTLQSLYEWVYIVADGGETDKYSYTRKDYKG